MEQNICRSYQRLVIVVVGEPILVGNENHIIRNMTFVGGSEVDNYTDVDGESMQHIKCIGTTKKEKTY